MNLLLEMTHDPNLVIVKKEKKRLDESSIGNEAQT